MFSEKLASRGQLLDLAGRMTQNMPADLSADITQEWIDDPEALQQFLATLHDGPIGQIQTREFEVLIDPKRTVEEWVAAGKYDFANSDLTTTNLGRFLTIRKDAAPYRVMVVAFNIGRPATIEKAQRIRSRLKLGPIGFEHEAAVGEQHPDAQRELNWLVNLDAVWARSDGGRLVAYLYGNPGLRDFSLDGAGGEWSEVTWFFGLSE